MRIAVSITLILPAILLFAIGKICGLFCVERQPPCPRATTILAGFQAAEVGVSFNVSG